ncbi:MAG: thioesterase [Chitinophagaceae bacterium]|nr:thioesterase [Chitinophagaceae bacterium]
MMTGLVKLFCLPFAGGSKYSYRLYEEYRFPNLKFIPLDYPGRGALVREPFADSIHSLVNDLYRRIKDELDSGSYAIYGHSMGGVIAYLLTKKIISNGHNPPLHLFITGTPGPGSCLGERKNYHLLNKTEFLDKVRELEGLPKEFFENKDLLDYFEPILRADFTINEKYVYEAEEPLPVLFTVITGTEEDLTSEEVLLWQRCSALEVDFRRMEGSHFFIFNHARSIVQLMWDKLFYSKKVIHHGREEKIP